MKERLIESWKGMPFFNNKKLIAAFRKLKREDFILPEYISEAYADIPLPIPEEQTISQPTTIMIMVDALEIKPEDIVLEIGGGSGYNAALISMLCKKVYSLELVPNLVDFAKKNLKKAKIKNVEIVKGDGSLGCKKSAPFDKIICTAACPQIPPPWIKQLKEGGIIVAPVGDRFSQEMVKARKVGGELQTQTLGTFMFVPLRGKYGFE